MPTPFDFFPEECAVCRTLSPRRVSRSIKSSVALLAATFLLALCCASCGAVGSAAPIPLPVTITVTPASAQPYQGESVQFHVAVQNAANPAIEWQVNGSNGGNSQFGTIDSNGLYTAPATVPNPPTVKIIAVLQSDATQMGSSSVTVLNLSSITGTLILSPALTSATTSQTVQFHVLTPGVTDTDVTWTATGGTITSDGKYSPPAIPGPYTVVATLIANANTAGSATVEVTDFAGTLTWRNDNARSGVNNRELALTPGNVNSSKFGKLLSCPIDGYASAQPLYVPNLPIAGGVHNVVFVATEKDLVFAFDADASPCQQLWSAPAILVPAGSQPIAAPNFQIASTDIIPFIGITGTPVIDRSMSALYAVAAVQDVATASMFNHWLYALDLATGNKIIQLAGKEIASLPGPARSFSSSVENQSSALLLDHGMIFVGFGSYGESGDSRGWMFSYDLTSLNLTGQFDVAPIATSGGGISQSSGPSADSNGNVFVATGDGPFNFASNYIDSIVRLGTNGGLSVADYFTPCDQGLNWGADPNAVLQSQSSAPVLLPDSAGSLAQPHLLVGGSKEGFLYVVNRDFMGGFPSPCSDSAPRVQAIQTGGAILSNPLFWNNAVYIAPGNGKLISFPLSDGNLSSSPSTSQSPEKLGPQGAAPVISSNGTNNAILWLIDSSGAFNTPNSPAILRAYDPNNLSNEIYSSPSDAASPDAAGPAVKFTVPTVANGKVYVGTQTSLDVFGYLH